MSTKTPLDIAISAYRRPRNPHVRRTPAQIEDAHRLAACGVFSKKNIYDITGLPYNFTFALIEKTDNTGGRLNPKSLWLMRRLARQYKQKREIDKPAVLQILDAGTSQGMLSKLTGIPQSMIQRWAAARSDKGGS